MINLQNDGISPLWGYNKQRKVVFNEPGNLSGWQLIGKMFIWLLIGWIIAALLFVALSFMGSIFMSAIGQMAGEFTKPNPLLSLILLFVGFLATFIWNSAVAWVYNMFYTKKYHDSSKTFGLLLLTNAILLIAFAPLYLIFSKDIQVLFFVLWFHIIFSTFVSASQMEFVSNPNFSWSSLIGSVLWFSLTLLVYGLVYKSSWASSAQQQTYLLMLLPSILAFVIMPLGAWIWEKIYYKFYEMWNNGFFIPSVGEEDEDWSGKEQDINIEN